jgi:hypothetical protein
MSKQSKVRRKVEETVKVAWAGTVLGLATVFFYFYSMKRKKRNGKS